jgi:hypothetical protein
MAASAFLVGFDVVKRVSGRPHAGPPSILASSAAPRTPASVP